MRTHAAFLLDIARRNSSPAFPAEGAARAMRYAESNTRNQTRVTEVLRNSSQTHLRGTDIWVDGRGPRRVRIRRDSKCRSGIRGRHVFGVQQQPEPQPLSWNGLVRAFEGRLLRWRGRLLRWIGGKGQRRSDAAERPEDARPHVDALRALLGYRPSCNFPTWLHDPG